MDISPIFLSVIHRLKHVLYPPRCLICNGSGQKGQDLCGSCEQSLPWLKHACHQCALPLPDDSGDASICGRCLKKTPFFDFSLSLFSFEKEVVTLIHKLKFHGKLAVSRLFGDLLADTAVKNLDKPDCLLPVPLYKKRLKKRGFNQSIEICRSLEKAWDIPIENNLVNRTRDTQSQTGLDAKQRKKNIRGVFEITGAIKYAHVAIVDDVVTTGSTVNELARILKKGGVKKVSVYSIARALAK